MDYQTEYITQTKINPYVKNLEQFLSNKKYSTPKGCPFTNIVNQMKGPFHIPETLAEKPKRSFLDIDPDLDEEFIARERKFDSDIAEFFHLLEECRKSGAKLHFSEMQYFTLPNPTFKPKLLLEHKKHVAPIGGKLFKFNEDSIDDLPQESEPGPESESQIVVSKESEEKYSDEPAYDPMFTPTAEQLSECIRVDKSCIEFDFDIYQRDGNRLIGDTHYYTLTHTTASLLQEVLDFESCKGTAGVMENIGGINVCHYNVIFLRKPEVVEVSTEQYGRCYKDSFHFRIMVKVSKEVKKYIINLLLERGLLPQIFQGISILNPFNKVLDPNSVSYPAMFLGSMKSGGKICHEFYKLYHVTIGGIISIIEKPEFNPILGAARKIPDPRDKRKKVEKPGVAKYKYNLCYETSLCYEDPRGFIKKPSFDPKSEISSMIRSNAERNKNELIPKNELEDVRNQVTDLVVRNCEAKYLQKVLDILSPHRVQGFTEWKAIIIMLAHANPDYKPLAIWFSHRCPQAWVKKGAQTLDSLWQWSLDNPNGVDGQETRTINTIYAWAKEDDPKRYEEIQDYNAFMKLKNIAFETVGCLNETHIAEILKTMFGKKFVCDQRDHSNSKGKDRVWYEFVFPGDDQGMKKSNLYKWRKEDYPDTLDRYICKKLPGYINKIIEWVVSRVQEGDSDEEGQKYHELIKKNLKSTVNKLGQTGMISHIISRCELEFRNRGFASQLDTNPNVAGVANGVLKVFPVTELIQRYHEIPICRTMEVEYEAYNANNPFIKTIETEIRRLFYLDEDAFHYTMCYLASSLDGRKKNPLFYIWLGEGSNGKSFLLELHINTLQKVVEGGYGAKLNVAFFTEQRKGGGPDSEKMMLKFARFSYCSESNEGEVLIMSKIKEFTSETISGNEKHQTQDMFEANCHFVFCSNNDPRITGRDYGTWRRIIIYRFKMQFLDNPNPENPCEYKRDPKFANIFTKDPNYKKAYLSILVKYYEMYRDKYNCDLNNIPKPTIDRETKAYQNEQDTVSRFVNEQVVILGPQTIDPVDGTVKKVDDISMVDVCNRYVSWYINKIDDRRPIRSEVLKALRNSQLKKYIAEKFTGAYLSHCRLLELGEDYTADDPNGTKKKVEAIAASATTQDEYKSMAEAPTPQVRKKQTSASKKQEAPIPKALIVSPDEIIDDLDDVLLEPIDNIDNLDD
jgi:phage/plasmid-associated DNA primase